MVQYQYPEQGWSTGKMRKRGEKLAMMKQGPVPQLEMERSAGAGLAARGGVFGTSVRAPQDAMGSQLTREAVQQIDAHKQQIQDGVNQVAQGSMGMGMLNKLLKKLGWSRLEKTGEFVDPKGTAHVIDPQQPEEQK